jgi:hypothetical protein
MTTEVALGVVAGILLLSSPAGAGVVSVNQTLDYTANDSGSATYFFVVPGEILDHTPHYRGALQDWGWTHDLSSLIPADATGIESATLTIDAWDVNLSEGERDIIYANGVELGLLSDTVGRNWGTTSFTLPSDVLAQLWTDGQLNVFMNIDAANQGLRVTLGQATLMVNYIIGNPVPEPATVILLGLGGLLARRRRR